MYRIYKMLDIFVYIHGKKRAFPFVFLIIIDTFSLNLFFTFLEKCQANKKKEVAFFTTSAAKCTEHVKLKFKCMLDCF